MGGADARPPAHSGAAFSSGDPLSGFRARIAAVDAELGEAAGGRGHEDRAAVRESIVTLFRDVERTLEELTALRESIRPLVERYKAAYASPPSPAAAAPTRVDHLGSSTHSERAWSALAAGQHAAAAQHARRALELAPGDPYASSLLGWALAGIGSVADARAVLQEVLRRSPGHTLARTCLGYAALRDGHPEEAIEHLSTAAGEQGDRKAALYANHYLGMALSASRRFEDARAAFARALELGPNLVEAYWEIGLTYHREGSPGAAAQAWRRGARANRFDPWAERCGEAAACLADGRPVPVS